MPRLVHPQNLHRLSALAVRTIMTPGWHTDGGGLHLEVDDTGRKRWAMRITVNGKRRDFGLGPIHKVSLMQAREMAARYRSLAYQGIDPTSERKAARAKPLIPTFAEAAERVHQQRRGLWSNGKHVDQWLNTLRDYAFPRIGDRPLNEIGTPDVLAVLAPIWTAKPETARRVRQRIGLVLDWARAAGHRSGDNPIQLLGDALPRHKKAEQHHAALPYTDVPRFIELLRAGRAETISKLAFEFLILTAARTKEVRGARWVEIDRHAATWTIPGDDGSGRRMKSGREHVVPLSQRALAILDETRGISEKGASGLIFPDHVTGRMMSENRFLSVRDSLGYKDRCTPHGFRSSFRDWAAEETAFPSEVAEMALAHAIRNKVEAAYRRGQLLGKRRELMDAWAEFVASAT